MTELALTCSSINFKAASVSDTTFFFWGEKSECESLLSVLSVLSEAKKRTGGFPLYLRLLVLLVVTWFVALGWMAPIETETDDETNGGAITSDVNRRSCAAGLRPVVPAAIRSMAVAVFMFVWQWQMPST